MHRYSLAALGVALFAVSTSLVPGRARAASAWQGWSLELERALGRDDTDRVWTLTDARPGMAQVWFYGHLFDVVDAGAGLTPDQTVELVGDLGDVADALAAIEPPIHAPRVLIGHRNTPHLEAMAAAVRALEKGWAQAVAARRPTPIVLAVLHTPDLARLAAMRAIFRVEMSRQLGNASVHIEPQMVIAEHLAVAEALARDDLEVWDAYELCSRDWHRSKRFGEPFWWPAMVDALRHAGRREFTDARALIEAVAEARSAVVRHDFVSLWLMLARASAAGWVNHLASERDLRTRVLAQGRSSDANALVGLTASQLADSHIAAGRWDAMRVLARDLREAGGGRFGDPYQLEVLTRVRDAALELSRIRLDERTIDSAFEWLHEAELATEALLEDRSMTAMHPPDELEVAWRTHQATRGELHRTFAGLMVRSGRFDVARRSLRHARAIYEGGLDDHQRAAETDIEIGNLSLAEGRADDALIQARTAALREAPAVDTWRASLEARAQVRLGASAVAATIAEAALARADETQSDEESTAAFFRGELAFAAAVARDAVGDRTMALAHAELALAAASDAPEIVGTVALLRSEAGDHDAARAALRGLLGVAPLTHAAMSGCVEARAGAHDIVRIQLDRLDVWKAPEARGLQMMAATCAASSALARNDTARARRALAVARAGLEQQPDIRIEWRIDALTAAIAASRRQWRDAATAGRRAVETFRVAAAAEGRHGATAESRTLALPADLGRLAGSLPDWILRAGGRDAEWDSLRYALWAQDDERARLAAPLAAPSQLTEERRFRALRGRVGMLASRLANPALDKTARDLIVETMRDELGELRVERRDLDLRGAAWRDYALPEPPEKHDLQAAAAETRLYYHLAEPRSLVWRVTADGIDVERLEGRGALEARAHTAAIALAGGPIGERDSALAALADAFLRWTPPTDGRPIWRIFNDGPLIRCPLGAARVQIGKERIALGARVRVRYAVGVASGGARGRGGAGTTLITAKPCAQPTGCGVGLDEPRLETAPDPGGRPAALARALGDSEWVWLSAPMPLSARPDRPAASGRPNESAGFGPSTTRAVVMTHLQWSADLQRDARAMGSMLSALRYSSVPHALIRVGAADATRESSLAAALRPGADIAAAFDALSEIGDAPVANEWMLYELL